MQLSSLAEIYPVQLVGTVLSLSIIFGLALMFSQADLLIGNRFAWPLFSVRVHFSVNRAPDPRTGLTDSGADCIFYHYDAGTLVLTWVGTMVIEKLRHTAQVFDVTYT